MALNAAERHGGNGEAIARRLGCPPEALLDASASLVPFGPPRWLRRQLRRQLDTPAPRVYPDRGYAQLRAAIAYWHGLDPEQVLPGNGAAELFTWAARDAVDCGASLLPQPCFADYARALATWRGAWHQPTLLWQPPTSEAQPLRWLEQPDSAEVIWITNPHNPTGQLWSRASLEPLLRQYQLVIVDEAFLPLVPGGECQSLIPLLHHHTNLVVIRSLTKLLSLAGVRLGYALASPQRLAAWRQWRDPWPVNGLAAALGQVWFTHRQRAIRWHERVQGWVVAEGAWLQQQLAVLPGIEPCPSSVNFLLIRGDRHGQPSTLQPLREALETHHHILLRDCRSFAGLDETWLRIGYQSRRGNRRIIRAMRQALNSMSTPARS
jgi:histidinol-phosphate/aromatic aminotransferase/cobyric acid decarboxylase-like protein